MRKETRRTAIVAVVALIVGAALWSVVPNLFVRKKLAPAAQTMNYITADEGAVGALRSPAVDQYASLVLSADAAVPDRKVVRTADLELVVGDVSRAADSVRSLVQRRGGFVEKSSLQEDSSHRRSGRIVVRVPAAALDDSLAELKKLAIRVARENVEARDVTREYMDNEATLRNLRAEEDQYLSILKRASTIKDTLETTDKLQEVRGEIDKLQGELNYLRSQVEMSAISVQLTAEGQAEIAGIYWHPLVNARAAMRDMLQGLGDWVDAIVALVINLPLILVWVVTVLFAIAVIWRVGRRVWRIVLPRIRAARAGSPPAAVPPSD